MGQLIYVNEIESDEDKLKRGWIDEHGNPKELPYAKTVEQGASTSVWAAVSEELENKGGHYLDGCQIGELMPKMEDIFKSFTGKR